MVSVTHLLPINAAGPLRRQAAIAVREYIADAQNPLVPSVAEALTQDGALFRPLMVHGPTASGKTLLATALLARWRTSHPAAKTLWLTAADYARLYADACETDDVPGLRRRFTQTSFVVMDDIHHLSTRPAAQTEFRFLLDQIAERDIRLVLTCANHPSEIPQFDAGLASRLNQGLVLPLAWPGLEARREIAARYFATRKQIIPAAALDALAQASEGPPSRLLSLLAEVHHAYTSERQPPTLAQIEQLIAAAAAERQVPAREIIHATAKHFRVKVSDLKGPSRRQNVVLARSVAMHLLRSLTHSSYQSIGSHFSNRDHTTVMHACQTLSAKLEAEPALRQQWEQLVSQLQWA